MKTFKGMTMMRAAVLLCGFGLVAGAAVAQDDAPPPPPAGQMQGPPPGGGHHHGMNSERRMDRLKHELNLTDDQASQLKAAFEDSQSKMEALRGNTSLSHEDRRSQMMAIHQTEESKVHSILTPDQQTKYDAMQAKMRERAKARHDGAEGQAPGDAGTPPPPPPPPPQN